MGRWSSMLGSGGYSAPATGCMPASPSSSTFTAVRRLEPGQGRARAHVGTRPEPEVVAGIGAVEPELVGIRVDVVVVVGRHHPDLDPLARVHRAPADLGVGREAARRRGYRRVVTQRLLDQRHHELAVLLHRREQLGVLEQAVDEVREQRASRVHPRHHHELELGGDLLVGERLAVDLGRQEEGRHVVRRVVHRAPRHERVGEVLLDGHAGFADAR